MNHRGMYRIGEFMEWSKHKSLHGYLRLRFVRGFAAGSAVISLLFLSSCPSAFARGQHGLTIKVLTSPDHQFWFNSVIVEADDEVMSFDGQSTKPGAANRLQQR